MRKYADLAIWDFNPLEVGPEKLKDWRCETTSVEGRKVYSLE